MTRYDDVLFSPSGTTPKNPGRGLLLLDGTSADAGEHSPLHEKIATAYAGIVPSTSLEFSLLFGGSDGTQESKNDFRPAPSPTNVTVAGQRIHPSTTPPT